MFPNALLRNYSISKWMGPFEISFEAGACCVRVCPPEENEYPSGDRAMTEKGNEAIAF